MQIRPLTTKRRIFTTLPTIFTNRNNSIRRRKPQHPIDESLYIRNVMQHILRHHTIESSIGFKLHEVNHFDTRVLKTRLSIYAAIIVAGINQDAS